MGIFGKFIGNFFQYIMKGMEKILQKEGKEMYTNYPYYTNQTQQRPQIQSPQIPPQLGLKGHPVTNLEEVKAAAIDFDGSIFFFPDLANKKIYTKQISMDGSAIFNMYELKEMPIEQNQNMSSYITREEFETTLAQIKSLLEPKEKGLNF